MARSISMSVGVGGGNKPADVVTIQTLLNLVPPAKGGPLPVLDPDGACGPMTISAILKFQAACFGAGDGRVDPGGQTLGKLNAYDNGAPGAAAAPPPAPGAPASALRKKIIEIANDMATPPPGKVSDLVTMKEAETGLTVRAGWKYLKDFFDTAVSGWQPTYWNNPEYLKGVKIPGRRIPQPGRSGISWCGIFATWVLIKAGMPVKWVLGAGISPLPKKADGKFRPGDVLVMKGEEVHHCVATADQGATVLTVNGNSDYQGILEKPVSKSSVAYYYLVD